jgi:hypothetical protein
VNNIKMENITRGFLDWIDLAEDVEQRKAVEGK